MRKIITKTFELSSNSQSVDLQSPIFLARYLEKAQPELSNQFQSIFKYEVDEEEFTMLGIGIQFCLKAEFAQNFLTINFFEENNIILSQKYDINIQFEHHKQFFQAMAHFYLLVEKHLLSIFDSSDNIYFMGGWKCLPVLKDDIEPFYFVIPKSLYKFDKSHVTALCYDKTINIEQNIYNTSQSGYLELFLPSNPVIRSYSFQPDCMDYIMNIINLTKEMSNYNFDKTVICRSINIKLESLISPFLLLEYIKFGKKNIYEYVFKFNQKESWIGISPETLVRQNRHQIIVEPLAGTRKGSDSLTNYNYYKEELLTDKKELNEHDTAAMLFLKNLEEVCKKNSLQSLESKSVLDLGYVQHLKSRIVGILERNKNIFDILSAVYPPATIWGNPIVFEQ